MKRASDLPAFLLISVVAHAGVFGSGVISFPLPEPIDKPFDVVYEIVDEVLPEQYEIQEEKAIGPARSEPEEISPPTADDHAVECVPENFLEAEEVQENLLRYQDSIKQKIQRERNYPRAALRTRYEGTVRISFTVLPSGHAENVMLRESSGSRALDAEALDAVRRASPFPPFPADFKESTLTIEVAIVFTLAPHRAPPDPHF
jgi:protein TonB